MHSYVIDELSTKERETIRERLLCMGISSSIEDMFWCSIPYEMLSPLQKEHFEVCGPYSMALTLEENSLQLEMLVRAQSKLHCSCVGYASPDLRSYMISFLIELVQHSGQSN